MGIEQGSEVARAPASGLANKLGYGAQASNAPGASIGQRAAQAVGAKSTGFGALGLAEALGATQTPSLALNLAEHATGIKVPENANPGFDISHPIDTFVPSVMQPLKFIGTGLGEQIGAGVLHAQDWLNGSHTMDAADKLGVSAYEGTDFDVKNAAPHTQPAGAQPAGAQPAGAQPAGAQTRTIPTAFANPMDAGPHPDLSAQLASAPKDLSTVKGLQQGAIYKTTGASGNPMYSGMNVGANAPFVDGLGKSVTPRGSVGNGIVGEGSNVVDGNAGLRAAQGAGGGPDVSGALQAAAQRGDWDAVKGYYQRDGGTWLGKTAQQDAQENGPGALLMAQIRNGLAKGGTLTRAGLAALQSLDATQRQYAATMAGHDVQRRGQDLNYDSSMYGHRTTAGLGAMQKEIQLAEIQRAMRNEALKNTNENIERSPLVMGRDKDGVAGPDKEKMARMKQFFDKNNFYSMDPAAQENAKAQFGLAEAVRNHLMNATGGVEPTPGTIKVTGVRDAELADTGKGRGLWRGVTGPLSPGGYGKSVTLNVNGVEQAVPADLFEGDNLAYVNQALEQLGYKPLSPHHLTGGK